MSNKELIFLAEGRLRKVFLSRTGKYVIKFPLNERGYLANSIEARDFTKNYFLGRDKLARCRLFKFKGEILLIMERVSPISLKEEKLPDWTSWVDCRQVGYNRHGKLVAYDWDNV